MNKPVIVNVGTVGHVDHGRQQLHMDIEQHSFFRPQRVENLSELEARVQAFWAAHPEYAEEVARLTAEYEHQFLYGNPDAPKVVFCNGPMPTGLLTQELPQFKKPKKKVRKLLLDGTPRSFFQLFE